jgi:hypothetical protein
MTPNKMTKDNIKTIALYLLENKYKLPTLRFFNYDNWKTKLQDEEENLSYEFRKEFKMESKLFLSCLDNKLAKELFAKELFNAAGKTTKQSFLEAIDSVCENFKKLEELGKVIDKKSGNKVENKNLDSIASDMADLPPTDEEKYQEFIDEQEFQDWLVKEGINIKDLVKQAFDGERPKSKSIMERWKENKIR